MTGKHFSSMHVMAIALLLSNFVLPALAAAPTEGSMPVAVTDASAPAHAPAAPDKAKEKTAPSVAEAAAPPPAPLPTTYHSLLFTLDEIIDINQAANDYRNGLANPQESAVAMPNMPDLTNMLLQRRFYLSSLVYHAENDWVVWMHDQQFTPQDRKHGDLAVAAVNKDNVVFNWQPRQLSFYTKRTPTMPDARVVLNKDETITFTLYPNQTFVPATMRIEEGTIKSAPKPVVPLPNVPAVPLPTVPTPDTGVLNNSLQQLQGNAPLPSADLPAVPTVRMKDTPSQQPPPEFSKR